MISYSLLLFHVCDIAESYESHFDGEPYSRLIEKKHYSCKIYFVQCKTFSPIFRDNCYFYFFDNGHIFLTSILSIRSNVSKYLFYFVVPRKKILRLHHTGCPFYYCSRVTYGAIWFVYYVVQLSLNLLLTAVRILFKLIKHFNLIC